MSVETQIAETWLRSTLGQIIAINPGPRVYAHQAPQNAVYPLIIFSPLSATDINALKARGTTRILMQVKAVSEGQTMPQALADSIDELLQDVGATQDGVRLRWKRVQTLEYTETRNGKRYNHLGGIYRCFAG